MTWTRHWTVVEGRTVHVRRLGHGPAVFVLHGSPQSSRAVEAAARAIAAKGLCVIAPDTPGNGLSDALAMDLPRIQDYAQALLTLADALGLKRFGLYGFHTGASIACTLAAMAPGRVAALAFDGLSSWTEEERAKLLDGYLPEFAPSFDGAHMTWAWARMEEQTIFFPWHIASPNTRMNYVVPPPAAIHANVIDLFDAGNAYIGPYRAAFLNRAGDWLDRVEAPIFLGCNAGDPLREHLERDGLRQLNGTAFADFADLHVAAGEHLARYPGDPAPGVPPTPPDRHGLITERWDHNSVVLAWRGAFGGRGSPAILLHGAGGAARSFETALRALAPQRPVLAFDLHGHGLAGGPGLDPAPPGAALVDAIQAALTKLGLAPAVIIGDGIGAKIAGALKAIYPEAQTFALNPIGDEPTDQAAWPAQGFPDLEPVWDGAHLVRAWRIARFEQLFTPWFRRDGRHRRDDGDLDPASLHARAVDLLKAGHHARTLAATWLATPSPALDGVITSKAWWRNLPG